MKFPVLVEVKLREGIADPQGTTIERALPALGFEGIEGVRVGKAIRFMVEAPDAPLQPTLMGDGQGDQPHIDQRVRQEKVCDFRQFALIKAINLPDIRLERMDETDSKSPCAPHM